MEELESEFSAIGKEITELNSLYKKCIPQPEPLKSSSVREPSVKKISSFKKGSIGSFFNEEGKLIREEEMYQDLKPSSNRSIYERLSNRDIIKGKQGSNIRVRSYHSLKGSKNSKRSRNSLDSVDSNLFIHH